VMTHVCALRLATATSQRRCASTQRRIPKTIEVLHGNGRLWEGIYLLEDDTMTVCIVPVGHQRPTSFTTTANAPPMLVVFKRDASVVWDMAKWQKAVAKTVLRAVVFGSWRFAVIHMPCPGCPRQLSFADVLAAR